MVSNTHPAPRRRTHREERCGLPSDCPSTQNVCSHPRTHSLARFEMHIARPKSSHILSWVLRTKSLADSQPLQSEVSGNEIRTSVCIEPGHLALASTLL